MKTIFAFLLLLIGLKSFSQVALLRGRVKDSTENGFIQNARLKFIKNDTTIVSGFNGSYRIELSKYLVDTIEVTHLIYGTAKLSISLMDKMVKELDICLPVACKAFPRTDICPKCKTNLNVIDIIYGYPAEKTFERAERGEIRLGGCVINDCVPHHYCKKDDLEF